MPLQSQIQKIVDDTINRFIANIATKLKVSPSSIEEIWKESQVAESSSTASVSSPVSSTAENSNNDLAKLQKMKKDELKDLCKDLPGYTARLTKVQLIDIYTKGSSDSTKNSTAKPIVQTSKPPTKKLGLLDTSFLTVSPWKSDSSLLVHEQTGILMDTKTSKAVGCVDSSTGLRRDLTVDDLNTCKKFKILYDVKGNLDSGTSSVSQVDELDEDDDSDEEELVEEDMLLDEEDEEFEELDEDH